MAYQVSEIEHKYGDNVHILDHPFLTTLLSRLSRSETVQPTVNQLMEILYAHLLNVVIDCEFPTEMTETPTRMTEIHPDQKFKGKLLRESQKAVCVNLARAGSLPTYVSYNMLNFALNPEDVRQDHIFASRTTNNSQQVTGTDLGATKIGGGIEDSIVLFPDPMGATGGTIISAVEHYKEHIPGTAKAMVAMHLIVTPEYLRRVVDVHPDVKIYSVRLDRGLSPKEVLETTPGEHWEKERGLNDQDYIVPGAGGLGEILNNSFV